MSNMPAVSSNTSALQSMFKQSKVDETAGGGLSFLKFDSKRLGLFLFGAAGEDVTDETIAIDISTWKHGQIQWHNKKCQRRMVPVHHDMPEPFEPIEYTDAKGKPAVDESDEGRSFEFTFIDGTRGLYEVSTFGGRKAIDAVYTQIVARATNNSPFIYPHVKLVTSSYQHTQWGLVYEPVLEVVAWYDDQGNLESAASAKLAAPAAEKKAPAKRTAAQVAAPDEPADEASHDGATASSEDVVETPPADEQTGQQDAPPRRRRRVAS